MRDLNRTREFPMSGSKTSRCPLLAAALLLFLLPAARAQQDEEQKGVDQGNYNIKQSIEFGGRLTSLSGDSQTYDTFVNLQQGPRLLGFTTEMRSLDHHATLLDRLYFTNFGYGGDPNNVSRLRASKNKWYNFDALFRKDQNVWNYSLLANPINPTTPAFANAPAGFSPIISSSPHLYNTRRKLGDYNLLVLPESRVRIRLGYSRNIAEGPAFTTLHEGTEALLLQDIKTTVNAYRLGVDFRLLPRTNISYDQIWNYYKGDTGVVDNNQLFALANGTPVDIGVSLNAGANQPCGGTFLVPPPVAVKANCNGYLSYGTHGRTRTSGPTEQLNMQSNYWQNLDLTGRLSYTGGDMIVADWSEAFNGLATRTSLRDRNLTGPASGRRVNASADFGATWHVTNKFSILDSFHFGNYHNPSVWDFSFCNFFAGSMAVGPTVFSPTSTVPLNCTTPTGFVAGTPVHTTSSPADIAVGTASTLLKVDEKTNLFELEYQFTPRFGARLGYRYRSRTEVESNSEYGTFVFFPDNQNSRSPLAPFNVDDNGNPVTCPVANNQPDGTCILTPEPSLDVSSTPIHQHAGVFGIWARPTNNWRISFDAELMSADASFTRISPRQAQEYRVRTAYKPVSWLNLNGSMTVWEGRNNVPTINNLQHSRTYGFSAQFQPNEKFGLDLGYDYNDVYSQIIICFVSSAAPANLAVCPGSGSPLLVSQLSTYTNKSHYGFFDFTLTPIHRLTARVGANLTGTSGSALLVITPSVPTGPLNSKWLHPFGGLDYHFAKNWTGKAYWDFYGYHEDSSAVPQDLSAPRNFRGNLVTLSVRYAF
jgi:hypothetical protein